MIDLNNVKFMTSPEGIRGAKIILTDKIRAHECALIYIHRYDIGCILGLQRNDNNKIEWARLLDAYNEVNMILEDPGFLLKKIDLLLNLFHLNMNYKYQNI